MGQIHHLIGATGGFLDHSTAAAILVHCLPDANPASLEPAGQGDFCLAFRWNQKIIRVARHTEAAEALKRETCVLAQVADRLPLPVPHLTYHSLSGCPPFTIHDEVLGEVLTREAWENLPQPALEQATGDLAAFLLALHAPQIEVARPCALTQLDSAKLARDLRETAGVTIRGFLDRTIWRQLEAALETWSQPKEKPRLALLHCDIAPGHLLFDPHLGKLTGIIDFGDIAIGEPARDFIYIYEDFGSDLLNLVLDRYAGEGADALMQQIQKWYILETTAWTIEMHTARNPEDTNYGLAEITREISLYFSKYSL